MIFLSCFGFKAGAQNIQVFAKLDQTTIRIGDQTRLHLTVEQPAKEQVNFPKLADTLTHKIQIVGSGKADTIYAQNDHSRITVTQSFTVTSFDAGAYVIPSFAFGNKAGVLKTNELVLTVQAVKVDTTKSIYDIKQPLAVSYSWTDWLRDNWYWVVFPLLAIVLIVWGILYVRKHPKKKPVVQVVKKIIPVHTIALNQLKELNDKKLWQQNEVKQYYSELSEVIREYLEKRYVIKTHEKTTDEIFAALKQADITAENKNMLHQLLVLSDLVKFAKEKPLPVENEQSMEHAVDFVLKTQPAERPEKREGGQTGEHV
ncbi:BatD family protein [Pedobacter sp. L105]|uniref:BatD family protein n=1 Tax=Pedobacter sp. L105 TaxID=1641871 RepID=UPI0020B12271|nr:BatD family protein [Pedobacter sp. L105]